MPHEVVAQVPLQYDGKNFKLAAPEPNPKHGGVLRLGRELVPEFRARGGIEMLAGLRRLTALMPVAAVLVSILSIL